MFCDKCGTQINDSDAFCTTCGNKIIKAEAPPVATPVSAPAPQPVQVNEAESAATVLAEPVKPSTNSEANTQKQASANQQSANYNSSNYKNANSAVPTGTSPFGEVTAVPTSTVYSDAVSGKPIKPKSNKWLVTTIIICSILLAVLVSVFVYLMLNNKDNSQDDPVDDPIVISSSEPTPTPEPEEEVNEIDYQVISDIIYQNAENADFGIYVLNLNNGYEFGYNEDRRFPASAMCQVVILDVLSNIVDEEQIDIDDETYKFYYLEQNGKEAPDSKDDDRKYVPISDYVEDIAMYGDNNKCNAIVDYLGGFSNINDYLSQNGYYNTEINRKVYTGANSNLIDEYADPNMTTAEDISLIFHSLITESAFGSESYMSNIFKSVNIKEEPIGLKKYIDPSYTISSANGINSESTNDVAIISNGETKVLVSILCQTQSDKVTNTSSQNREAVQDMLIDYILETQFE